MLILQFCTFRKEQKFLSGNLKERDPSEDLNVDGKIILK
jgi:hypothetical protein